MDEIKTEESALSLNVYLLKNLTNLSSTEGPSERGEIEYSTFFWADPQCQPSEEAFSAVVDTYYLSCGYTIENTSVPGGKMAQKGRKIVMITISHSITLGWIKVAVQYIS